MKKNFLICLGLGLLLCGCSNNKDKFENFEHYDLNGKDIFTYTYNKGNGANDIYAIADITPEKYETGIRGLFYKVSSDDYILLDKIESSNYRVSANDEYNVFYENKLYAIGNGTSPLIAEYTLNHEKIVKKELDFEIPETPDGLLISTIDHIQDNYVYFSAFAGYGSDYKIIKCSLNNYKCAIKEN